jgi:hypothetical protein
MSGLKTVSARLRAGKSKDTPRRRCYRGVQYELSNIILKTITYYYLSLFDRVQTVCFRCSRWRCLSSTGGYCLETNVLNKCEFPNIRSEHSFWPLPNNRGTIGYSRFPNNRTLGTVFDRTLVQPSTPNIRTPSSPEHRTLVRWVHSFPEQLVHQCRLTLERPRPSSPLLWELVLGLWGVGKVLSYPTRVA